MQDLKIDTEKHSYVYFVQQGDNGPIKIGHTKNINKRITVIQVDNPSLIRLLCVFDGGRSEEINLHKRFSKYKIYGEWFEPSQEIIEYISKFEYLGYVSTDFKNKPARGDRCHNWKGEQASQTSKRQRAKAYKRYRDKCERCGQRGKTRNLDTIYLDGNKDNLKQENIAVYCRRCRMEHDGTLDKFLAATKPPKKPLSQCKICQRLSKNCGYGRCHACAEYFRHNGIERSDKPGPKQPVACSVCSRLVKQPAKGKCHTCYEYFRKNGVERPLSLRSRSSGYGAFQKEET